MSSLLPQDHAEFRSKQYWDQFFQQRGNVAFEWYGSFKEVSNEILQSIDTESNCLVIGCGNSEFSANLYDCGYRKITNMDFSKLVIDKMIEKNKARPEMQWHVGDMTAMDAYGNESYDVVFDKGALDALMSENTLEVRQKAIDMFREIQRVLKSDNGKYMCITLIEPFILDSLLSFFVEAAGQVVDSLSGNFPAWSLQMKVVPSAQESPFKPFLLEISKLGTTISTAQMRRSNVVAYFDTLGTPKMIPTMMDVATTRETIHSIQQFHQQRYQLQTIQVGRFTTIQLLSNDSARHITTRNTIPRFTVFILDAAKTASLSCAVFMVPFGREADYQFSTEEGLLDIARQAGCKRLLAVCCNRPHEFPPMAELQSELSPVAMSLCPRLDMRPDEQIPYMAIQAESDWYVIQNGESVVTGKYVIEESLADNNDDDDGDNDRGEEEDGIEGKGSKGNNVSGCVGKAKVPAGSVLRRLIFLRNQTFVQTEVRLVPSTASVSPGDKKKKKKKNAKKKKAASSPGAMSAGAVPRSTADPVITGTNNGDILKATAESVAPKYEFDFSYLDDHHRAILAALSFNQRIIQSNFPVAGNSAGRATTSNTITSATAVANGRRKGADDHDDAAAVVHGLVIGLGGGTLLMAMQRYLRHRNAPLSSSAPSPIPPATPPPTTTTTAVTQVAGSTCQLTACDLDPELENIAQKYFGLVCARGTKLVALDGLELIDRYYQQSVHFNSSSSSRSSSGLACGVDKLSLTADSTLPIPPKILSDTVNVSSKPDTHHLSAETYSEAIDVRSESSAGDRHGTKFDFIVLDVDSKDSSLGMSAPPMGFVTESTLQQMYTILRPGGLLIINVVARSKAMLPALLDRIAQVFFAARSATSLPMSTAALKSSFRSFSSAGTTSGHNGDSTNGSSNEDKRDINGLLYLPDDIYVGGKVFKVKPSTETVNVEVVAVKGTAKVATLAEAREFVTHDCASAAGSSIASSAGRIGVGVGAEKKNKNKNNNKKKAKTGNVSGGAGSTAAAERAMDQWLKDCGLASDPLNLKGILEEFEECTF